MVEQKSDNITWHAGHVGRKDREGLVHQRGVTVWLTGLSGSGKSTIAVAAEAELVQRGHLAYVLDGDNIRRGLNKNLGFSPEDRTENIRR
ncbi:MAG: adenylyl-sulfate kinase, partial [bacterium]|nr:adenylyl-sulfate kinase [bacterium]